MDAGLDTCSRRQFAQPAQGESRRNGRLRERKGKRDDVRHDQINVRLESRNEISGNFQSGLRALKVREYNSDMKAVRRLNAMGCEYLKRRYEGITHNRSHYRRVHKEGIKVP